MSDRYSRSSSSRRSTIMSSSPSRNGVDSPSKQLFRESRRNSCRDAMDSPSRQLWEEFMKLQLKSDRAFQSKLDQNAAQLEKAHTEALARAAEEHNRVRQSAEEYRERLRIEYELEKQRREEEEKQRLEKLRREKAERDEAERKRRLEELARFEEEQKRAAEQQKQIEDSQARIKAQKEKQEADEARRKAEQAESDRKAQEAAAAAAKANVQQPQAPKAPEPKATEIPKPAPQAVPQAPAATPASTSGITSTFAGKERSHRRYLDLHKQLKAFRQTLMQQAKQQPQLKEMMSNVRREVKTKIGQLTVDKMENRSKNARIKQLLEQVAAIGGPTVDARQFIISQPVPGVPTSEAQVSAILIFQLNHFSKAIIAQFLSESSVDTRAADHIGVTAAQVFSNPNLQWRGISFVDILMAKFHRHCPVLFGIYGNDRTEGGRRRLGWHNDGEWVSEQTHSERMTGLGAGFSSIALRDFSKAKAKNPVPNSIIWHALANIINTPANDVTDTHYYVLKALLEHNTDRFIKTFGYAAIAALKKATIDFPALKPKSVGAQSVSVLPDMFKRNIRLTLQ